MAIFIFNVPARTMKREREALAGVPLLTSNIFEWYCNSEYNCNIVTIIFNQILL